MEPLVSYVVPAYNESAGIKEFYKQLTDELDKASGYRFEIIFINDGSADDTLDKLIELQKADPRVIVINFSRNFGHQIAITAGLDHADGDAVIIMDSDLQDPPAVSIELIEKWREGYDIVYAQRQTRNDTPFKRWTAHMFYRTLEKMAEVKIPTDTGDFRLMSRAAVREFRKFREHNRFVRGMVASLGFRQAAVRFKRPDRFAGETHYPLKKMLKLALDGMTSFSTKPLEIISHLGFWISGLSLLGIIYALVMRLVFPEHTVSGWTVIVISILFMGGVQLVTLGVIGSYVGRIYTETQNRPLYIISEIFKQGRDDK